MGSLGLDCCYTHIIGHGAILGIYSHSLTCCIYWLKILIPLCLPLNTIMIIQYAQSTTPTTKKPMLTITESQVAQRISLLEQQLAQLRSITELQDRQIRRLNSQLEVQREAAHRAR